VRFYLDEHFSSQIAEIARGHGLDVVSALELGHRGLPDLRQLEFAAHEDRCLVTKDRGDFNRLYLSFLQRNQPHSGVLIVPRSLPSDRLTGIAQALKRYADSHADTPMTYVIDYLTS
jgi:predicted nuclease of predicted toxin-antitoxin system